MITIYETAEELERAADAAKLSMRAVCLKAGLAPTTWYRWRNATAEPILVNWVRLGQAIEELKG